MDYTKFLNKKEELVLPYLGGPHVHAKDRRLRVDEPRPAIGFHRFEVRGRNARAVEAVDPDFASDVPKARGHIVVDRGAGWLCHAGSVDRLALFPEEEPPPLATARARRWWSGDHLFEALDFDGDAEEEARLRLERREPLGDLKGVHATLRNAFGIALALATAERNRTPLSVREAEPFAAAVAERGVEAALPRIVHLVEERRRAEERSRLRALMSGRPIEPRRGRGGEEATLENAAVRAEAALDSAGATMRSSRRLAQGNLEVTFEFMGERFISVVDAISLQVWDSGVCLAGEDRLVTLDSLPGVIREAIQTRRLVITRR
jgi:hypothetical protein